LTLLSHVDCRAAAKLITGDTLYIGGGYHVID
jgi:hypothetical protein